MINDVNYIYRCELNGYSILHIGLTRWLYEHSWWLLLPVYRGFPVKLRTYIGKPIPYDPNIAAKELAGKVCEFYIRKNYTWKMSEKSQVPYPFISWGGHNFLLESFSEYVTPPYQETRNRFTCSVHNGHYSFFLPLCFRPHWEKCKYLCRETSSRITWVMTIFFRRHDTIIQRFRLRLVPCLHLEDPCSLWLQMLLGLLPNAQSFFASRDCKAVSLLEMVISASLLTAVIAADNGTLCHVYISIAR